MSTKQQRELEARLHEEVYNNVFLLTLKHAPPESFNKVFKRDMFMKNNKVAFQQVVYYLLSILNPIMLTQKITVWPIYDSRSETQFRNEVMKYLNELNAQYEDADIPTVLTSHLVSPGGYRFMKFMLMLTQLVLFEELRKDPLISKEMLHRILPNKSLERTNFNIRKLKEKIRAIDKATRDLVKEFECNLAEDKRKAECIMQRQSQLNSELPEVTRKLATLQQANQQENGYNYNQADIDIKSLQDKINQVRDFDAKLEHLCGLVSLLCSGELCLDGRAVDCASDELNLLDLLREFNELLHKRCLEMRVLTKSELSQTFEKYAALNEKMQKHLNKLSDIRGKLSAMLMNLKQQGVSVKGQSVKRCLPLTKSVSISEADSTVLAVPLNDT